MFFRTLFQITTLLILLLCFSAPILAEDLAIPQEEPAAAKAPSVPPAMKEEPVVPPPAEVPSATPAVEKPAMPSAMQEPVAEPAAAAMEAPTPPETEGALSVGKVVICRDVQERSPVGEGTLFANDVGKLFCHSLILGAEEETAIHHVWYWNDQKMADVPLTVRSAYFRTYSSKSVLPQWSGAWRVEVQGPDGAILSTAAFNVE